MRLPSRSPRSAARRKSPPTADLTRLTDAALLEVVIRRSDAAWRELMRRFRPLLYCCMYKTAWRQGVWLGEDERGEVFGELACALLRSDMRKLRAWRPGRCKLGTWLGMLASHATSDHLRRRRRQPVRVGLERAPEGVAGDPSALEDLLDYEERSLDRRRWRCLVSVASACSAEERGFFELHFAQRLPTAEVAARLGISPKTVQTRATRLRRKLASLVREDPRALRLCEPDQRLQPPSPARGRDRYRLAG